MILVEIEGDIGEMFSDIRLRSWHKFYRPHFQCTQYD